MPATLNLQKTVGRNQIHRIHGFPPLGMVPKTCASDVPPACGHGGPTPGAACCPGCSEAYVSSHLAPGRAQCVNSINKQQMEKYISQENGGSSEFKALQASQVAVTLFLSLLSIHFVVSSLWFIMHHGLKRGASPVPVRGLPLYQQLLVLVALSHGGHLNGGCVLLRSRGSHGVLHGPRGHCHNGATPW